MSITNLQGKTTSGANHPTSSTNSPPNSSTSPTTNSQTNLTTQKNKRTLIDRVTGKNKNIPPPKNILPYTNEYEILQLYDNTEKSIKEKMMISIKSIFNEILPQFLENSMNKFNTEMKKFTGTSGTAETAETAGPTAETPTSVGTAVPTKAGTTTKAVTTNTAPKAESTNTSQDGTSQAGGKKKTRRKLRKLSKKTLKRKKNSRNKK